MLVLRVKPVQTGSKAEPVQPNGINGLCWFFFTHFLPAILSLQFQRTNVLSSLPYVSFFSISPLLILLLLLLDSSFLSLFYFSV